MSSPSFLVSGLGTCMILDWKLSSLRIMKVILDWLPASVAEKSCAILIVHLFYVNMLFFFSVWKLLEFCCVFIKPFNWKTCAPVLGKVWVCLCICLCVVFNHFLRTLRNSNSWTLDWFLKFLIFFPFVLIISMSYCLTFWMISPTLVPNHLLNF